MKIAMCPDCHAAFTDPTHPGYPGPGYFEQVVHLMRRGAWSCMSGRTDCGMVEGRTQEQIRDDIFKVACIELLENWPESGKAN